MTQTCQNIHVPLSNTSAVYLQVKIYRPCMQHGPIWMGGGGVLCRAACEREQHSHVYIRQIYIILPDEARRI